METTGRIYGLLRAATATLLLLASVLLLPQGAGAWPFYLDDQGSTNDFVGKYPAWPHKTGGAGGCLTCHTTNAPQPGQLNPYGSAFQQAKAGATAGSPGIKSALAAIAAQDSDGDGVPNEVEILFATYPGDKASKPTAPGGVNASDATFTDKVQVTWSAYANATFHLYRADSPEGPKADITSTSNTQYADTTAAAGKTYHYWVKACNSAGCTDFSAPDAGMRKVAEAQPPQKPWLKDPSILGKIQVGPPAKPADLTCSMKAYKDQGKSQEIAKEGTVSLKGLSAVYFAPTVANKGTGNATPFSTYFTIYVDASWLWQNRNMLSDHLEGVLKNSWSYSQTYAGGTQPLGAGKSEAWTPIPLKIGDSITPIGLPTKPVNVPLIAKASLDIHKQVVETNKDNNGCWTRVYVTVQK